VKMIISIRKLACAVNLNHNGNCQKITEI